MYFWEILCTVYFNVYNSTLLVIRLCNKRTLQKLLIEHNIRLLTFVMKENNGYKKTSCSLLNYHIPYLYHLRKPSVFGPLRSPSYSGSGVDRKHLACEVLEDKSNASIHKCQ